MSHDGIVEKKANRGKRSGLTSFSPLVYTIFYLINIIVFTFIYSYCFKNDFDHSPISFVQSLYFSIVTITTLGYGDITPKLDSSALLLTISAQVVLGVVFIGLFLNAISHQLSDSKDFARQEEEKETEEQNLSKLLTILKPVVIEFLGSLAETYKVTTTQHGDTLIANPRELFNQSYYDQICRQDFLSDETRYGKGRMLWGNYIDQENSKFSSGIDDFLNKYATKLPIEIISLLATLKLHPFLEHSKTALKMRSLNLPNGMTFPKVNLLTMEHSSVNMPNKPKTISEFHEDLLTLIDLINGKTRGDDMVMRIDLRKGVTAPPVGSAIGEIISFGPA
jgi:hypothetical protein